MDFKDINCECVIWIQLAQKRVQWRALEKVVVELQVP